MIVLKICGEGYDGNKVGFIGDAIEKLKKIHSKLLEEESPEVGIEEEDEPEDFDSAQEEVEENIPEKEIIKSILASMFGTDNIEVHRIPGKIVLGGKKVTPDCTRKCTGKCPHGKTCKPQKPEEENLDEEFEDIDQID